MGILFMKDQYNRQINYLRISVTDRCNLRCNYCMPQEGIKLVPMDEILTYEEINVICEIAAKNGITDIRITGGEPLVRNQLYKLIGMIKEIPGIKNIGITTNGVLLAEHIDELVQNGLTRVNISLDTLDPQKYIQITRRDYFSQVMYGIKAAINSGIKVKINSVLTDLSEVDKLISLAKEDEIDIRFIELMPIGMGKSLTGVSNESILNFLQSKYSELAVDSMRHGSGPAIYYKIAGFKGSIGLISPIHSKFCDSCNRVRLSATGKIKSCLCYANDYDLRPPLREGKLQLVEDIFKEAVYNKPKSHCFEDEMSITESANMVSIGG